MHPTPAPVDPGPQPGALPSGERLTPNTDARRSKLEGVALRGTNLWRRFGETVALAGVDVVVGGGEALAAMGPSGSGKSTLLHCLAGVERPDLGEVWLGERRIDRLSERERSRLRAAELGFVFQSGQLLPELPAVENVALPLMLTGTSRRPAVAEATRWFGPLGIEGLERRRPGELSGGQAQRVAIARALVARPRAVFADEPTAALDRATGREVVDVLVRACRASGAALLVVTHDPEVAAACDRILHLRDGAVVDPGLVASTTSGAGEGR
ncbi:MAG TPA: ABC transporter ATP-binding protein [Iamia sp.]|nr:ABC transporter ATP-binding protein [Iamia sp.]